MSAEAKSETYQDLISSCAKIDGRKTNYRFDIDVDVRWDRVDDEGLHFGPTALEMLGIDTAKLGAQAADVFQWAYAMSVCEAFYDLEDMVVRFTEREQSTLGSSRSVNLLCEEEMKHMAMFERYGQCLRESRPDLARRWDGITRPIQALPGSPEDEGTYPDAASYHYMFWINTLFFEEFTIFLHHCLEADKGLIHPTWASVHECHENEEAQHLPTDVAHLKALALSPDQRALLSKAFFFRLENEYQRLFGLKRAWSLVTCLHPEAGDLGEPCLRELPIYKELLFSKVFRRSRDAAPHISDLARTSRDVYVGSQSNHADMAGKSLPKLRTTHLADILRRAALEHPDSGLVYLHDDRSETSESYAELLVRAQAISSNLQSFGLKQGGTVLLLLDQPSDFIGVFWACQLTGLLPVPAPKPKNSKSLSEDRQIAEAYRHLDRPLIITDRTLNETLPFGWRSVSVEELASIGSQDGFSGTKANDIALLQFSSGSTGNPRGVVLTQENIIANLEAVTKHLEVTPNDRTLSWMPLHHDMGLCLHLASIFCGLRQMLMTPREFAKSPGLWLEKLQDFKATISASPNFGLAHCTRRLAGKSGLDLDLSSVRCILNGAEPISPACTRSFMEMLKPAGLKADAIHPCYGLAEATTAVTIARPGEGLRTREFDRNSLADPSDAVELTAKNGASLELVDVGEAIPGMQIRICKSDGSRAEPGLIGEIEIRGPNVTSGYWNDAVSSSHVHRRGGWIRTGDLGIICTGRLYVAGRKKNVIFVNGRNFLAEDLEASVREIEGVAPNRLAVIGRSDSVSGTEQVLVFLHHRVEAGRTREQIAHSVSAHLADIIEYPVHRVIFLSSGQFPLTTSGKVQRYRLREAFERGEFDENIAIQRSVEDPGSPPVSQTHAPLRPEADEAVVEIVRSLWADVLNQPADTIDIDRHFFDLGGDSLRAIELLGCLEDRWGLHLDQRLLMECRTVREQASFLSTVSPTPAVDAPQSIEIADREASEKSIAIIAMAGRFPSVDDLNGFWKLLKEGRSVYGEPPTERWNADDYYDSDPQAPGKTVCRVASFLDGIGQFDAKACGLGDEEARQIDPQQRIFLEIVLDLIDRAHLNSSRVGVFAGAAVNEYFSRHATISNRINRYSAQTNLANMLAARVSQLLRFTGPALTLDAACATSLVAIHYACRSLQSGECELAIAGGVQLNLTAVPQLMFSQAQVLSPRGHCHPYAKDADGFVPGEGAGAVLLKPLAVAIRDHDPILGIIRGSAVNNDGGAMSDMAPNPAGQVDVIRAALHDAGVGPESISYVEGHGAGTRIGDLVEMRSLSDAFAGNKPSSVGLGSVKSNFGHLFHAAGVCSVIKVLSALRHQEIPPTVGCEEPNPQLQFERTPLCPVQTVQAWPRVQGKKRLAGVSAFGVGGTNCHLIIEEPPEPKPQTANRQTNLLCLSAPGPPELARVQTSFADALAANAEMPIAEFCATANQRANRFQHRASIVVRSREDAIRQLRQHAVGQDAAHRPPLMFLFPGPGGHYAEMGRHLYEEGAFIDAISQCDSVLQPIFGHSLRDLFTSGTSRLDYIEVAQPASFAFGYAIARWLESLGILPDAVLGHSGGEYTAACIAGVLSLQEAARLSHARGLAMHRTEPGRMAVVHASADRVRPLISQWPDMDIACINSPNQCVVSGVGRSVEAAGASLRAIGLQCDELNISCAAHSSLMESAQQELMPHLTSLAKARPRIPFFSSVTGAQEAALDKQYWHDHLRSPVLFQSAVNSALNAGYRDFVELGPNASLSQFVKDIAYDPSGKSEHSASEVRVYPVTRKSLPGWEQTMTALGKLFENGVPISTAQLDGNFRNPSIDLPSYPYMREKLWIEPPPIHEPGVSQIAPASVSSCKYNDELDLASCLSIRDHIVHGASTAPSGLLLDLVLRKVDPSNRGCALKEVLIKQRLALLPDVTRSWRVREKSINNKPCVTLETREKNNPGTWVCHLSAGVEPLQTISTRAADSIDLAAILARCPIEISPERLARRLSQSGMEHGPTLNTVAQLWVGHNELITRLQLNTEALEGDQHHALHPGLLDGAIRSIGTLTLAFASKAGAAFVGFAIERVVVLTTVMKDCLAHVRLSPDCKLDRNTEVIRCNVTLVDETGKILAELREVCLKRHEAECAGAANALDTVASSTTRFYNVTWKAASGIDEIEILASQGSPTVLIGAPTSMRLSFEREVKAAEGSAKCILPPKAGVSWDSIPIQIAKCPAQLASSRVVFMCSKVEDLASLAAALANFDAVKLGALVVVSSSASVMAFLRSLRLEYPGWMCRGVLVDDIHFDAPTLYLETRAEGADIVVSYRKSQRYLPVLDSVLPNAERPALRQRGVYWVTGGMGALGQAIAQELARSVGARLFLTGLRHDVDETVLQRIEAEGGEAFYLACDVTDRASMKQARAVVEDRWGRLDGVIHTAGSIEDRLLVDRDPDHTQKAMRAKLVGAEVLADTVQDRKLDFIVLFSSLVALTGMPGQADYAAANAEMDALAHRLCMDGRPAKSLNWGPWAVGMAADERFQRNYRARGLNPFSVTSGVAAFLRALSCNVAQLAIVDLEQSREDELLAELNKVSRSTCGSLPVSTMADVPDVELAETVMKIVAAHLQCHRDKIGLSAPFRDLGIDSLMAVEIALTIQEDIGVRLYPTILLELQTLADLLDHLKTLMTKEFHQ